MTLGKPDANKTTTPGLRYTCLQTVMTRGPEQNTLPAQPCPAGIMTVHHFPALVDLLIVYVVHPSLTATRCWDGVNLDSPDHQSHMYDTGKGGFAVAGPCPASHPVRMPQLAYETLWNTTAFNDKSLWPTDGSQPFVWSTGDSIGYSTHGDYVFGWKGEELQKAMDSSCMFQACGNGKPLKSQNAAQLNKCSVKSTVNEETDGCELS